jgi:hypothetical protein
MCIGSANFSSKPTRVGEPLRVAHDMSAHAASVKSLLATIGHARMLAVAATVNLPCQLSDRDSIKTQTHRKKEWRLASRVTEAY